jgi:hypothetical protein
MSYGRYKRALLLKRVEVTTARMQKVEARLEQRSRIMQERRSCVQRSIKSTTDALSLKEEGASAYVDTHAMEKD